MERCMSDSLVLRPYQQKVVDAALKGNTLAVLPTGSGKTLVAIDVIRQRLDQIRNDISKRKKFIIFLVPTKILAGQQKNYIEKHSDAKILEVTGETNNVGGRKKIFWHYNGWNEVMSRYEVVVMTPQVLSHILQKKLFDPADLDTLVIDECHHASKHDPIATICRIIREKNCNPLILSMTASPVKCKREPVMSQIKALEEILNCKMLCTREITEEYRLIVPVASLSIFRFLTESTGLFTWLIDLLDEKNTNDNALSFEGSQMRNIAQIKHITFPPSINILQNSTCLLLYAFLRLKYTLSIKTIYSCSHTLMADPASIPGLQSINLPKTIDYRNYLMGLPLPSNIPQYGDEKVFKATPHILKPEYEPCTLLSDIVTALGQVVTVVEECGIICAVYSFIIALGDTAMTKVVLPTTKTGNERSRSRKKDRKIREKFQNKAKYSEKGTQSCIDAEKLEHMARHLAQSPFRPIDLFHEQYVTCISILDYFVALCAAVGPEICHRASISFIVTCKRMNGANNSMKVHVDDGDYFTLRSGTYYIGRMNGLIWLLFQAVCDKNSRGQMALTSEGCLMLIKEILDANTTFSNFQLRLDVCADAVRKACWLILKSIPLQQLARWFKIDNNLRYSSFEPLSMTLDFDGTKPSEKEKKQQRKREAVRSPISDEDIALFESENVINVNPTDLDIEEVDVPALRELEFISGKVKAISVIWKFINQDEDFALQWILSQQQMLQAMELSQQAQENGLSIDSKEDGKQFNTKDYIMDDIGEGNDSSLIIFCQKRLTARSLQFVLSMMLENNIYSPTDVLDTVYDENEDDYSDVMIDVRGEVSKVLQDLVIVVGTITDYEKHDKNRTINRTIRHTLSFMIDEVENIVLGKEEAQRVRYNMKTQFVKENQLAKIPAFRPVHLIGGMRQKTQLETLTKFKVGEYNVVFATDVMEEGLDVKACKYVINFDIPKNVKSFVQRRGRARAANSMFVSLVPYGDAGLSMISDLRVLLHQERKIEQYSELKSAEAILKDFEELVPHEGSKLIIEKPMNKKEIIEDFMEAMVQTNTHNLHVNSDDSMDVSSGEEADEEHYDEDEASISELEDILTEEGLCDKYVVEATGAEATGRSAVQVLISFCQQLPHDMVFSFKPIFWIEKIVHHQHKGLHVNCYRCSILLPLYVQPSVRFILGPLCKAKASAKRLAALSAVKQLHQKGELDDWLFCKGSALALKREKAMLKAKTDMEVNIVGTVAENNEKARTKLSSSKKLKMKVMRSVNNEHYEKSVENEIRAEEEMTNEDVVAELQTDKTIRDVDIENSNMINILVKVIPEAITMPAECKYEDNIRCSKYYLYFTSAGFLDQLSHDIVLGCVGCAGYYDGMNHVCMAFTRPIPDEALEKPFRCQIREDETVLISLIFIEYKWISDKELFHMQRFHKGVLCWETEDLHAKLGKTVDWATFSDDLWIHPSTTLYTLADEVHPAEHDEWRESSGGAWYLLFPCPLIPEVDTAFRELSAELPSNEDRRTLYKGRIFAGNWLDSVIQASDEAQILCNNMRVQDLLNRTKFESGPYCCEVLNGLNVESFVDMIGTRGPGGVFYVHRDNVKASWYEKEENVRRLSSVMKFVPDPIKEEVNISLQQLLGDVEQLVMAGGRKYQPSNEEALENTGLEMPTLKRKVSWDVSTSSPAKRPRVETNYLSATHVLPLSSDASSSSKMVRIGGSSQLNKKDAKDTRLMKAITYGDNLKLKNPECIPHLDDWLADPLHRLTKIVPISSVLTLTNLIGKFITHLKRPPDVISKYSQFLPITSNSRRVNKVQKAHKHSYALSLPLEIIRPVGRHLWLLVGLTAPTIAWRVQSFYLALEARALIEKAMSKVQHNPSLLATQDLPEDDDMNCQGRVPVNVILEAITPRLGREIIDYERLEFIGDSVLKFIITIELFRVYPKNHEGFLTLERGKYIGNHFLIEVAQKSGLQKYIRAHALCNGRHNLSIRPAGMSFESIVNDRSMWSANVMLGNTLAKKEVVKEQEKVANDMEGEEEMNPFQHLENTAEAKKFSSALEYFSSIYPFKHKKSVDINPKVVADVVEAVIGAYYIQGGTTLAMSLLKALNAWPEVRKRPDNETDEPAMEEVLIMNKAKTAEFMATYCQVEDLIFPSNYPIELQRLALGRIKLTEDMLDMEQNLLIAEEERYDDSAVECVTEKAEESKSWFVNDLNKVSEELERILGYKFRNLTILEEALTHCSVQSRSNNQRLEFLGDAVLDLAVITLLYQHEPWATQGDLSHQKSSATNNRNLGSIAGKLQLYRFLRHSSLAMEGEFNRVHTVITKLMSGIDISTEETMVTEDVTNPSSTEGNIDLQPPSTASEATATANDMKIKQSADGLELVVTLPSTTENTVESGTEIGKTKRETIGKKIGNHNRHRIVRISNSAGKALADMFEALIGAIFLDSGGDIEPVKAVVKHINLLPQLLVYV